MVLSAFAFRLAADTAASAIDGTWLTPAFITAVAGLVAAVATLVAVLRNGSTAHATQATVQDTHATVTKTAGTMDTVAEQTNGTIGALQARISQLEGMIAGRRVVPTPVEVVPPVALVPPAAE